MKIPQSFATLHQKYIWPIKATLVFSHFKSEHVPFFNQVTYRQLKDAASAVLSREKRSSLAELFSIELKFTQDTLKAWFNRIIE